MSESSNKIHFHFLSKVSNFKNRESLKIFLEELFYENGFELDALNYIFCSDVYLLSYNKQYLNHSTLTDIITFELNGKDKPILGDIYISTERINENAKKYNSTLVQELHRVIFHGALHLCGYKDKTQEQKELMRNKEDHYLRRYFVSRETF